MRKNLFKLYIFIFVLFSDYLMFATTNAAGENEDGTGETIEEGETPINSKLIWLFIAGVAFAFYYFSNNKKKQVSE